jgi:hypothetical protein
MQSSTVDDEAVQKRPLSLRKARFGPPRLVLHGRPINLPQQVVEGDWVGHLWYRARPLQPPDARVYARADLRLDKAVLE